MQHGMHLASEQSLNQFKNRLMSAFAQSDVKDLITGLNRKSVPSRHIIYAEGALIEHVYFVEEGVASVLMSMGNGSTIEVGMIGFEGMLGMPALLGADRSAHQVIMQIPGTVLEMNAADCKRIFDQSATVRAVVHRFMASYLNHGSQTAACNRLHSVEQRCARWLLMSSDRVQSDVMSITQEFLSAMLGVRRAGVTETAGQLQRSGIIEYHRGQLRIIDREALEATACECYRIDRARFENLLQAS